MLFLYIVVPALVSIYAPVFLMLLILRKWQRIDVFDKGFFFKIISVMTLIALIPIMLYLQHLLVGGETFIFLSLSLLKICFACFYALLCSIFGLILYLIIKKKTRNRQKAAGVATFIGGLASFITYSLFSPETFAFPYLDIFSGFLVLIGLISAFIIGVSIHRKMRYVSLTLMFISIGIIFMGPKAIVPPALYLALFILGSVVFLNFFGLFLVVRAKDFWNTFFKKAKIIVLILMFLASSLVFLVLSVPAVQKTKIDEFYDNLSFSVCNDTSLYPTKIENLRLVDRRLASDFALTYRLPKLGDYKLMINDEEANIGLINGKPSWVLPVYYQFAWTPKINKIVGYLYINLDTPIFESMKFVEKEMKYGPSLFGSANIKYLVYGLIPDGIVGEYYLIDPSPVTSSPAWVILVDKITPSGARLPYKVLIVGAQGDYRFYNYKDAAGIVPQIMSYKTIWNIHQLGYYMRNYAEDLYADGFLWIPASQDSQDLLYEEEYYKPHHFLINDGYWWGRDFYLSISTSGGETSICVWTVINSTIILWDLRFYKGITPETRGVNPPSRIISSLIEVAQERFEYNVTVRYPKLYRVDMLNSSFLIWLALVVQQTEGADRLAGVVFVDASNPRITGFVQYLYGETQSVFKSRMKAAIEASYLGWTTGNETTTLQTAVVNGTLLGKSEIGFINIESSFYYIYILKVLNNSEAVYVVLHPLKVASLQDYYRGALAKEGEDIYIEARWDIDLQQWTAYKVEI